MPGTARNRRWILAVVTAVLFPAIALHGTCIAVMGPGTWGSGLQEVPPEFKEPPPRAVEYGREIETYGPMAVGSNGSALVPAARAEMRGRISWVHLSRGQAVYLTDEVAPETRRQRLYIAEGDHLRQVALPGDHVVVRPQWTEQGIVYERWNPWAIPAARKLQRYFASWVDPPLRPEAALYKSTAAQDGWRYSMPGHSLSVSPDGRRAAFLRSGALLAGYYSIHVWPLDGDEASPILSLREHDGKATRSFSIRWSKDSRALRIHGRTGGFERRGSRGGGGPSGIAFDLLYLITDGSVYDLNFGG